MMEKRASARRTGAFSAEQKEQIEKMLEEFPLMLDQNQRIRKQLKDLNINQLKENVHEIKSSRESGFGLDPKFQEDFAKNQELVTQLDQKYHLLNENFAAFVSS